MVRFSVFGYKTTIVVIFMTPLERFAAQFEFTIGTQIFWAGKLD